MSFYSKRKFSPEQRRKRALPIIRDFDESKVEILGKVGEPLSSSKVTKGGRTIGGNSLIENLERSKLVINGAERYISKIK